MNHALAAFFPKRNPHVTIFDLRENSLDATSNNMLDRESLRFVNRGEGRVRQGPPAFVVAGGDGNSDHKGPLKRCLNYPQLPSTHRLV